MAFAAVNFASNKAAPAAVNFSTIDKAFAGNSSLKKRVYDAIIATPQYGSLFEDIAKYTCSLGTNHAKAVDEEPTTKRRKLHNGDAVGGSLVADGLTADTPLQFYMQDVTFAIPQRKKLRLEMTSTGGYVRARNQASGQVEFGLAVKNIQHVLCVPVPDKPQRLFNFCIIPRYGDGVTTPPGDEPAPESILWTVADGPPKAVYSGNAPGLEAKGEETAEHLIRRMLDGILTHTRVIRPDEREFVSAMPEAHRKREKAYHAKAFRGSKDGYLFFLSTGVFFGFKKPVIFFGFEVIESISYTSILQHTFNLNIAISAAPGDEIQEFEFSMIDQADYAGIDAYVKKHGLQDASLADARRAKKFNVNGLKEEAAAADGMELESELQKAERELEDQEDEEDYDPGSDGESEGSGTSLEDEDSEGGSEEDVEGKNLVEEELGSEADEEEEEEEEEES